MRSRISKFITKLKILPSWVILIIDLLVVFVAALFALVIRDNFHIPAGFSALEYLYIPFTIVVVRLLFFYFFKTYTIVVRFTNTKDVFRIFLSCISGSVFLGIINIITYFWVGHFLVPTSVIIMEFFITMVAMVFYRFAFKMLYLERINPSKNKKNIIIFGAGEAGITTKRALDRDTASKYNVQAFFEEDHKKIGKNLESVPVLAYSQLGNYLRKNEISFLIIAIQNLPSQKISEVTELALQYRVKVLMVPPVTRWINGELSFKQIKKVKIEDLLERDPIVLDESLVYEDIRDQVILITGAAGSIGSEIVRQVMRFDYKQLILIDNAETPVFYLSNECYRYNRSKNIDIEIVDILDRQKMEDIMARYKPTLIYHAAAYKHVPMMETNVGAAIKINVLGTRQMADLAVKYGVNKFVMVSTDKAVNPTTIMGATKRIAEIYVQSFNFHQQTTKFITTRFGNVLGSNGSVIPIFRQQIEEGGPVTVTHPDVTRYFMTIPEACQLVLNAGAMGKGGEIFIFDMGQSVRIYDLAIKMIKLSGLELGKDIQIEFTGLRTGEKLYEELLANQENTMKTDHNKIMIARVRTYVYDKINEEITILDKLKDQEPSSVVAKIKEIVPEFESKNPDFTGIS